MEIGTKLQANKFYYTKNGQGKVIIFNKGFDLDTKEPHPLLPTETATPNVWYCGISRHITSIAENKEDAETIDY